MAPESSFMGFSSPSVGAVVTDLYAVSILSISLLALVLRIQGLYLPCDLDFLTIEDPLPHDIFGLSLPPHVPPTPTNKYLSAFFPEMLPDIPSTTGVTQNHTLQNPHRPSILQPQTMTPYDVRTWLPFFVEFTVLSIWYHSSLQLPMARWLEQNYSSLASPHLPVVSFLPAHWCALPKVLPFEVFPFLDKHSPPYLHPRLQPSHPIG